jgi:DeoR/GlpR family transcriptional regulator of sugar metabolism
VIVEERRAKIVEMLKYQRALKVSVLTQTFGVSVETIRRDLEFLENEGFLKRVYGGAIRKGVFGEEPAYDKREVINLDAKKAIAMEAAKLIENGDTVFIDIGTTCLEVAKLLSDRKNLTVLTNSFMIAKEMTDFPGCRVFLLGGELRKGELSVSGFLTSTNINLFNADKAIIGAGGVTLESGITDYHPEEAYVRRVMIDRSKYCVVVTDSSKFGVVAMNFVCPLEKIGVLVTDDSITEEMKLSLEAALIPFIVSSTK